MATLPSFRVRSRASKAKDDPAGAPPFRLFPLAGYVLNGYGGSPSGSALSTPASSIQGNGERPSDDCRGSTRPFQSPYLTAQPWPQAAPSTHEVWTGSVVGHEGPTCAFSATWKGKTADAGSACWVRPAHERRNYRSPLRGTHRRSALRFTPAQRPHVATCAGTGTRRETGPLRGTFLTACAAVRHGQSPFPMKHLSAAPQPTMVW